MRRLSSSLRLRLTGAVMMPLTALVLVFSVITALVNHNTEADTVDRVLVGSVRTLSLAYNSPPADQKRLVPLVIHLLQRRARPVVHYSVYRGDTLVAGDPSLKPPADYRADWDGVTDRHPPATFKNAYRKTPLVRGYLDPADAHYVTQAAYLRSGTLHGKPVRIATEMRRAYGDDKLIAIQIADYLDDRSAYERLFLRQVLLVGVAVLLVTGLLFWWAIRWGLRPLSDLTGQVEAARRVELRVLDCVRDLLVEPRSRHEPALGRREVEAQVVIVERAEREVGVADERTPEGDRIGRAVR